MHENLSTYKEKLLKCFIFNNAADIYEDFPDPGPTSEAKNGSGSDPQKKTYLILINDTLNFLFSNAIKTKDVDLQP